MLLGQGYVKTRGTVKLRTLVETRNSMFGRKKGVATNTIPNIKHGRWDINIWGYLAACYQTWNNEFKMI